jgi:predicted phage-related endonuclease
MDHHKPSNGEVMTVERRQIVDRAEWLEWRKSFVTASQMGALFGCHPHLSALKLYLEKSGIEFQDKDTGPMRRGRILEPAVGAAVAEARPNWRIEAPKAFFCDPDTKIAATPDFLVLDDIRGQGVLQAKSADPSVYIREWAGGTEIPFWIVLQALTECMLTNAVFAVVAVLSVDPYGLPCSILELERHPEAEARIVAAVSRFWDDVEKGIEPAADYGKDSALIKILAPREAVPEKTIDLSGNNELPELLAERALLKARMNSDKERCEQIESQIKFTMRDAAIVTGLNGWRITYKTGTVQGYTVPTREQRVLRIQDKR